MKLNKTINSALGARISCVNFNPCKLCYGCRNYSSAILKCRKCYEDNAKYNICNREKHTDYALNLMIRVKDKIKV